MSLHSGGGWEALLGSLIGILIHSGGLHPQDLSTYPRPYLLIPSHWSLGFVFSTLKFCIEVYFINNVVFQVYSRVIIGAFVFSGTGLLTDEFGV